MRQGSRNWAARHFAFVLPLIVLLLAWPWAFFGLLRFAGRPLWLRVLAAGAWLAATVWLLILAPGWWGKLAVSVASVVVVRLVLFSHRPKLVEDWVEEQAKLTTARFDGDLVTIANYRHTIYRTLDDFDVRFSERSFDLGMIRTLDFFVVPFASWRGIAHVFVSFGFEDGEHIAVSVEARRQEGEPYSPVGGLYRQYEVIYVFGDERDVVAKRACYQRHPVYLYPMIVDPGAARALLVSMLEKANELAETPQFYHTVTNTCTSNVLIHATGLEGRPKRFDFRLVFPGFADGLAVETGLVEAPQGLKALREASLINRRAEAAPMEDGREWSRAIRVRSVECGVRS